jgi:hypothetical protein
VLESETMNTWPTVRSSASAVIVVAAGVFGAQGCSIGSKTIVNESEATETADGGTNAGASGAGEAGAAATCSGATFAKVDPTKLKACKPGGHCYDKAKVPGALQTMAGTPMLAPCDDPSQLCVPDEILNAGGGKLKDCKQPDALKAQLGEGGGCLNLSLFPEVEKQAGSILKQQEDCPAGLMCFPCKNPLDGSDSGFCNPIGVYDNACTGGGGGGGDGGAAVPAPSAQPCCTSNGNSNGVCMSTSAFPAGSTNALPQDSCAKGNACVPAAMVQGKPTPCDAGVLLGAGICIDQCFSGVLRVGGGLGLLSSEGCGETEVCAPCSALSGMMPAGVTLPGCT